MKEDNKIKDNCRNRWVACIDLLGFKARVSEFDIGVNGAIGVFVNNYYYELLKELEDQRKFWPDKILAAWFSDTFLFIARDDSLDSFGCISGSTKCFCERAMKKDWPMRAAIGFGQVYVDKSNNIFVGPGLIDAYENAEKQNWIGAVITAKANERLRELPIPKDLKKSPGSYKRYNVPIKPKVIKTEDLFVIRIPDAKDNIERMQKEAMNRNPEDYEEYYKIKYENTLKFLNQKSL